MDIVMFYIIGGVPAMFLAVYLMDIGQVSAHTITTLMHI